MKRRWFQIHLSTAIVMMFLAGALLWMNINPCLVGKISERQGYASYYEARGWPLGYYEIQKIARIEIINARGDLKFTATAEWPEQIFEKNEPDGKWYLKFLIFDFCFGCFLFLPSACFFEYLIRRREARKP